MREISNFIMHIVGKLFLIASLPAVVVIYAVFGSLFHLETVRIEGENSWQLRSGLIKEGLRNSGPMSLIFGNFSALESTVESMPAIRNATVRKAYPDELVVNVEARQPVARGTEGGLIDSNGEWYEDGVDSTLPVFAVSRDKLPQAVALYSDMRVEFTPLNLNINQLLYDEKGWNVFLSNGWVLLLGEYKLRSRMRRFATSLPQFPTQIRDADKIRIDLRYPYGMAIAGLRSREEK